MRDRGLHISVKKKYKPLVRFLDYYKETMGANVSELICELAMAGLTTEPWKTRAKVLSPPQQKVELVTTPKYVRPPKTDAEISHEKKLKEDELIKEQEKARQRAEEFARIKRIMGKQD